MLSLVLVAPLALLLAGASPEAVASEVAGGLQPALGAAAPDVWNAEAPQLPDLSAPFSLPTRVPLPQATADLGSRLARLDPAESSPRLGESVRPRAFEYSDAYRTRARIHRYASFATLPLFVGQFAVGQRLYSGRASDGTRSLHGALAVSTGALFGVNTLTGGWNLYEGRRDPNRRKKRLVHGLLMLAADAGFAATGLLAPDDDGGGVRRSTHRTIALSSMGVATASYLIMLIGD